MTYKEKALKYIDLNKIRTIIIIACLILSGMYVLNYLTPEWEDDFSHKFVPPHTTVTGTETKRIDSIGDIISYMPDRYMHKIGRLMVSTVEYSFTALIGKDVFNFINPFFFLAFIISLTLFLGKITPVNLLFTLSVVMILFPMFAETCLWMTGSIHYLWPVTCLSIFLYYLLNIRNQSHNRWNYLWVLPCFVIGWSHEGLSSPLAFSLIVLFLLHRYKDLSLLKKVLILSFVIGALFCFFAPGNFARASISGIEAITLIDRIRFAISQFIQLRAFFVFILVLLGVCIYKLKVEHNRRWLKEFYADNALILYSFFFSFGFLFASIYASKRINTGPEYYSIILILILLKEFRNKFFFWIKSLTILTSIPLVTGIFYFSVLNHKEVRKMIEQIESHQSDVILYTTVDLPLFFPEYVLTPIWSVDKSIIRKKYVHRARYYNYEHLVFLPQSIYDGIVSNEIRWGKKEQEKLPFYIVPLNCFKSLREINDNSYEITFNNGETILRLSSKDCEILKIKGKDYLFLLKSRNNDTIVEKIFS